MFFIFAPSNDAKTMTSTVTMSLTSFRLVLPRAISCMPDKSPHAHTHASAASYGACFNLLHVLFTNRGKKKTHTIIIPIAVLLRTNTYSKKSIRTEVYIILNVCRAIQNEIMYAVQTLLIQRVRTSCDALPYGFRWLCVERGRANNYYTERVAVSD
jgi:hypothetical protein